MFLENGSKKINYILFFIIEVSGARFAKIERELLAIENILRDVLSK
jgi:hypothetical protein